MPTSPPKEPRTLVLCFDGTSNEYDADNTNVVKLFASIKKDDFDKQIVYYQPGIGTWFEPGVVSPLFEWAAKIMDLAFAWYLDAHVMDGYKFLMQNYRAGDRICIFGFSRGAYTARALGGFLYKVGLLPRDNRAQVPFAYKMYKRTDAEGARLCAGFKQTYCQSVTITFMGVWDTVASVGVLMGRTLPFTNSNSSIKTFRHALALDERRAKFRPNNYHRMTPSREAAELDLEKALPSEKSGEGRSIVDGTILVSELRSSVSEPPKETPGLETQLPRRPILEKMRSKGWDFTGARKLKKTRVKGAGKTTAPVLIEPDLSADVKEVWFTGCHSDVGGGAVADEAKNCLGNISLRWMIREAVSAECGIEFDLAALERLDVNLDLEPSPSELEFDLVDALEPINDEMEANPMWRLLEVMPLHHAWQDADGRWHRKISVNLGRGRTLFDKRPVFHSTVRRRMQVMGYRPKAKWDAGSEVYVH